MSHALKMLVGCLIPLLLVFFLPVLGVEGDGAFVGFLVLMFACHLFMMRGHAYGHSATRPGKGEQP